MDKIKNLRNVYFTLDKISISGEENCSRIVGCRQVLAQVINELEQEAANVCETDLPGEPQDADA